LIALLNIQLEQLDLFQRWRLHLEFLLKVVNLVRYCELILSGHANQLFYYLMEQEVELAFDQDRGYDDLP
jgi:hypothetical protein